MSTSKNKLLRPQVSLGRDDRLMTWSSNLNIYRVNKLHLLDLTNTDRKSNSNRSSSSIPLRFDLIEQLLLRNMVDAVESIFFGVGLETSQDCLLVCRLWHDFLTRHLFKRWAERLVDADASLQELAVAERWAPKLHLEVDLVDDHLVYRRICARIFELREVWRYREPKLRRINCESFVLSLRFSGDNLYCGLNNGSLQLWDLAWSAKRKEQEVHAKGVKCIDMSDTIMVTGSYDCTAKVWDRRDWTLLSTITLHSDSVWDLRVEADTLVTAGLDGTVGMFELGVDGSVQVRFLLQAHHDLVAAVDFDDEIMVTGYEDSRINVWSLPTTDSPDPPLITHTLLGHAGGVTGLQLNGRVVASSSYDGTVRLWSATQGTCLLVLTEPGHFVRCVSFKGHALVSGDFGGGVHVWDVHVARDGNGSAAAHVKSHRSFQAHKGHVVCVQINARRIVSGSRDRTALVQDFWAKMLDGEERRRRGAVEQQATAGEQGGPRASRFLRR